MKVFAGSCVIETLSMCEHIVSKLIEDFKDYKEVDFCYKGSFDKANRTSHLSYRGLGLEKGLTILETIKNKYKVPVLTDLHLPDQADEVASVVDYIQIPAFLCRQTDLIAESAKACQKYNKVLKIKKAQFLSPKDMANVVKKASEYIPLHKIILTERGTCFGYNQLIVDMSSFMVMKSLGVTVIHDATHCVQLPGSLKDRTGGNREHIEVLARAAVAAGADGVFLECHPDPDKALSDPSTSLKLNKVKSLIDSLLRIRSALR